MINFALTDSLHESKNRYRQNAVKLSAFERSISNGDHRKLRGDRLRAAEAELNQTADDQERLSSTIPELEKTRVAFGSLSDTEKHILHRRLANPSGELKLVLQNRNGELLAA
jgi:hypothetical protein